MFLESMVLDAIDEVFAVSPAAALSKILERESVRLAVPSLPCSSVVPYGHVSFRSVLDAEGPLKDEKRIRDPRSVDRPTAMLLGALSRPAVAQHLKSPAAQTLLWRRLRWPGAARPFTSTPSRPPTLLRRAFHRYDALLQGRFTQTPMNIVTATTLGLLGDYMCQRLEWYAKERHAGTGNSDSESRGSGEDFAYNSWRGLAFSSFCFWYSGVVCTAIFNWYPRVRMLNFCSPLKSGLAMSAFDNFVHVPLLYTPCYFFNLALFEEVERERNGNSEQDAAAIGEGRVSRLRLLWEAATEESHSSGGSEPDSASGESESESRRRQHPVLRELCGENFPEWNSSGDADAKPWGGLLFAPGTGVKAQLEENWLPTFGTCVAVWLPLQFVNFAFVPPQFRVGYMNVCCLGWNVVLSWLGFAGGGGEEDPSNSDSSSSRSSSGHGRVMSKRWAELHRSDPSGHGGSPLI